MKKLVTILLAGAGLCAVTPANAAVTYAGSWTVDEGPNWGPTSVAYTGQEAAALLFGGGASDYYISTIDNSVANIDHQSWVSVWYAGYFADCSTGFPCGRKVAENSAHGTGGLYLLPGDESAYVRDWAVGPQFRNYAFRVTDRVTGAVPEPATWAMMIGGFGLVGAAARRRNTKTTATYA